MIGWDRGSWCTNVSGTGKGVIWAIGCLVVGIGNRDAYTGLAPDGYLRIRKDYPAVVFVDHKTI